MGRILCRNSPCFGRRVANGTADVIYPCSSCQDERNLCFIPHLPNAGVIRCDVGGFDGCGPGRRGRDGQAGWPGAKTNLGTVKAVPTLPECLTVLPAGSGSLFAGAEMSPLILLLLGRDCCRPPGSFVRWSVFFFKTASPGLLYY